VRNVWKGLVVGGLTGVAAGMTLDALAKASKKASALGDRVRERRPDAERFVQGVSDRAGEWLQHSDVPGHVRSASVSESVHSMNEAASDAVAAVRDAVATHSS